MPILWDNPPSDGLGTHTRIYNGVYGETSECEMVYAQFRYQTTRTNLATSRSSESRGDYSDRLQPLSDYDYSDRLQPRSNYDYNDFMQMIFLVAHTRHGSRPGETERNGGI